MSTATAVKFHVGLNVKDLGRAVTFYRALLGSGPAKHYDDYAKFDLDEPALVLSLYPSPQLPGGALNHLGLRLNDSAGLVAAQRRLEMAGIATQREEGVECCYARQTKFWVTDPDGNLWEVYTLHEDLDHHGFGGPPEAAPSLPTREPAIWQHRLNEPVADRLPHADGALDEVWLEGSLNADLDAATWEHLLAESHRVLRDGGKVVLHGLVSDRPFPGKPSLPGLAGLVRSVPTEAEAADALWRAGFISLFFERLGDIHCFRVAGVELRELRLLGTKGGGAGNGERRVVYKGPLAAVRDEHGTAFPRGERVPVSAAAFARLREGPAAGQFVFLAE